MPGAHDAAHRLRRGYPARARIGRVPEPERPVGAADPLGDDSDEHEQLLYLPNRPDVVRAAQLHGSTARRSQDDEEPEGGLRRRVRGRERIAGRLQRALDRRHDVESVGEGRGRRERRLGRDLRRGALERRRHAHDHQQGCPDVALHDRHLSHRDDRSGVCVRSQPEQSRRQERQVRAAREPDHRHDADLPADGHDRAHGYRGRHLQRLRRLRLRRGRARGARLVPRSSRLVGHLSLPRHPTGLRPRRRLHDGELVAARLRTRRIRHLRALVQRQDPHHGRPRRVPRHHEPGPLERQAGEHVSLRLDLPVPVHAGMLPIAGA